MGTQIRPYPHPSPQKILITTVVQTSIHILLNTSHKCKPGLRLAQTQVNPSRDGKNLVFLQKVFRF